ELHRRNQLHQDPSKTKALQTIIEMKDTKIASLERNIRDLEDEIQMLKANSLLNTEDREEEIKQMEVYKNHSKFMKTKNTKQLQVSIVAPVCTRTRTRTRRLSFYPGPGRGGSRLSRDAQTSLSPDTSSSSSGGSPRRSQAS
ncbi:hypothetical protein AMECASPLE_034692, partial [Ameca splendens]